MGTNALASGIWGKDVVPGPRGEIRDKVLYHVEYLKKQRKKRRGDRG